MKHVTACSYTYVYMNHKLRFMLDYFNDVLTTLLGLKHGSYLTVYAGSESMSRV